jgi:large subunit ribosomal protein L9
MDVILRQDIDKVGLRGDVVNVARGYARNFLLPRGLAEEATPAKVAELRKREEQRARHEAQSFDQAREMANALNETVLRFEMKSGPTGALFGSVTPTDIVDEIWREKKIRVDRRKVGIDNIKRIGRHTVPIELFTDVDVEVETLVVPEGGELPPEEELAAMEAAVRAEEEAAAAAARAQHEQADELVAEAEAEEEVEAEAETEADADVEQAEAPADEPAAPTDTEAEPS